MVPHFGTGRQGQTYLREKNVEKGIAREKMGGVLCGGERVSLEVVQSSNFICWGGRKWSIIKEGNKKGGRGEETFTQGGG